VIEKNSRSANSCGVDFWASLPSAVRRVITRPPVDPALGFASCRVVGHVLVHRGGLDPDAIISLRRPHARSFFVRPRALLSARGFGGVLPVRDATRHARIARVTTSLRSRVRMLPARVRPRRSLQRIDGADALLHPAGFDARAGLAPCLRFCTVRDER
jgi:hypothetical protein